MGLRHGFSELSVAETHTISLAKRAADKGRRPNVHLEAKQSVCVQWDIEWTRGMVMGRWRRCERQDGRMDMRAPCMCSVRAAMFDLHLISLHFCTFCVTKAVPGSKPRGKVEEHSIVLVACWLGLNCVERDYSASETDNVECSEPGEMEMHGQQMISVASSLGIVT